LARSTPRKAAAAAAAARRRAELPESAAAARRDRLRALDTVSDQEVWQTTTG